MTQEKQGFVTCINGRTKKAVKPPPGRPMKILNLTVILISKVSKTTCSFNTSNIFILCVEF